MKSRSHVQSPTNLRLKEMVRLLALAGLVSLGGCFGGGDDDPPVTPSSPVAAASVVSGTVGSATSGVATDSARKAAAIANATVTVSAHCNNPVACGQEVDTVKSSPALTVYKPLFSGVATTNAAGVYSIPMNEPETMAGKLANGGYFVVDIAADNTAASSFKIEFAGAPPASIKVPAAQLTEVNVQVATAGSALVASNGRNYYMFGLVRFSDGTRKALAGHAYTAARKANGARTELEIAIPSGSGGVEDGDGLVGRLASFDSSNPDDARRFPGEYKDTNGNTLVSLGFDFIDIQDENGQNLGDKAKQATAASASKAGGKARKAAINWTNPTVVTRYLPTGSANSLLRDSCTASYSEAIPDATSDCAALQDNRPSEWGGFNMPIYTYVPSKGAWELFGIGTIVQDYSGDEASILTYSEVGLGAAPTDSQVASAYQTYATNKEVYVRIYVTNESFQNEYWNLDYPLLTEQPVEYCVTGSFRDSANNPLPGNYVSVYDDDDTQSFNYGYGAVDANGTYRISVVRLGAATDTDRTGTLSWYNPFSYASETANVTLEASPSCATNNIVITKPNGTVNGRVVDASGNGKANRYVWAQSYGDDYHYTYGYTNGRGEFSFSVYPNRNYDYFLDYDYVPKGVFNVNGSTAGNEASDASNVATLSDIVLANQAPYASGWMRTPSTMRATSSNGSEAKASIWGYDYDGDWPLAWKITSTTSGTPTEAPTRARRAVAEANTCTGTEVASGSFSESSYSADAAFNLKAGNHSLCLEVKDNQNPGLSSVVQLGTVQVMGEGENRPPVISSLTASPLLLTMTDTNRTVSARASAYDLDSDDPDDLTYTWSSNCIITKEDEPFAATCNIPATAGSHVIDLVVEDSRGSSASRSVTVQVSNRAPVISAMSVTPGSIETGASNRNVTASVTASDPDGTALSYTWYLNDVLQECNGNMCSANLPAVEAIYTFRVEVSDGDRSVERSVAATVSSTNLSIGVR